MSAHVVACAMLQDSLAIGLPLQRAEDFLRDSSAIGSLRWRSV